MLLEHLMEVLTAVVVPIACWQRVFELKSSRARDPDSGKSTKECNERESHGQLRVSRILYGPQDLELLQASSTAWERRAQRSHL